MLKANENESSIVLTDGKKTENVWKIMTRGMRQYFTILISKNKNKL